jgi:hypothetical protein
VVIYGTASIASWDPPPKGPRIERHFSSDARECRVLIFDHVQRSPEALRELESWMQRTDPAFCPGLRRVRADVVDRSGMREQVLSRGSMRAAVLGTNVGVDTSQRLVLVGGR